MKTLTFPKRISTTDPKAKLKAELKAEEAAENKRRRARKELELFGHEHDRRPGALAPNETWWCQHYSWLKSQGYLLRPRYAPGWVPSWEGTERDPYTCEDGNCIRVRDVSALHRLLADAWIVWPNHGCNTYIRRCICLSKNCGEVAAPS